MDAELLRDHQLINGAYTIHIHVKEFNNFFTFLGLSECIYRQLDAIIISSLNKLTLMLSSTFHSVCSNIIALQSCDIYMYTVWHFLKKAHNYILTGYLKSVFLRDIIYLCFFLNNCLIFSLKMILIVLGLWCF